MIPPHLFYQIYLSFLEITQRVRTLSTGTNDYVTGFTWGKHQCLLHRNVLLLRRRISLRLLKESGLCLKAQMIVTGFTWGKHQCLPHRSVLLPRSYISLRLLRVRTLSKGTNDCNRLYLRKTPVPAPQKCACSVAAPTEEPSRSFWQQ